MDKRKDIQRNNDTNSSNLTTDINLQTQEAESISDRRNSEKFTLRCIIIKLLKSKHKEKNEIRDNRDPNITSETTGRGGGVTGAEGKGARQPSVVESELERICLWKA